MRSVFIRDEAEDRHITIHMDIPDSIPPVKTDRGNLQRIALNLVNNAFQAVSDECFLEIRAEMDGPDKMRLLIRDKGWRRDHFISNPTHPSRAGKPIMKLLLVDDEQTFVRRLAMRLGFRGFNAEAFISGHKALREVEEGRRYEVAILDLKMPEISGDELRHRLAVLDPQMKFVFLTGHGSNADDQVGRSEAEACLLKPLKMDNLLETLNRVAQGT